MNEPVTTVTPEKDTDNKLPDLSFLDKAKNDKGSESGKTDTTPPESVPEGFTQEEWSKAPQDWKDRFRKQSSSFQSKITEKHERYFNTEKTLVEKYPQRLKELVESDNPDDTKLAKQLAKDVFGVDLPTALSQLKDAAKDAGEDIGDIDSLIGKRESKVGVAKEVFIEKNDILNPKSKGYNKDVAEAFDRKFNLLRGSEILLTEDEINAISDEALLLATKGVAIENKEKSLDEAQRKLASAGGGGASKGSSPATKDNPFAGLPQTL